MCVHLQARHVITCRHVLIGHAWDLAAHVKTCLAVDLCATVQFGPPGDYVRRMTQRRADLFGVLARVECATGTPTLDTGL